MMKWQRPELIDLSTRDEAYGVDCGAGTGQVPGCAAGTAAGNPDTGCRDGGANVYSCLVGQGVKPPCTAGIAAI